MLQQLSERRGVLLALAIGGLLALTAGGIGLWLLSQQDGPGAAPQPTPLPTPPPDLELTLPPSLDELAAQYPELESILRDEALGSVYKEFLVAYETGGAEAAEKLARERGLLNERDEIRMTLVVDSPENTPAVVEELERFRITVTGYAQDEINVVISLRVIEILAEQAGGPEAIFAQLTQLEHVIRVKLPITAHTRESFSQQSVFSEGIALANADAWHQAGYAGQGVKVGVLDMGFAGYRALLGTELPANVVTHSSAYGLEDIDATDEPHGTACAEIVHEMAPEAELYLAHYDGTYVGLVQAVEWLLGQGVRIISYSVGTSYGPRDGSGQDAQLVDAVAAEGVVWVSAAGNEALAHYRGVYADADNDAQHEFPDGNEVMALHPFADFFEVLLQWDDWAAADQDYELLLYDSSFNLLASSTDPQAGASGHEPVEYIYYGGDFLDDVYYLAIEAYEQTRPAIFDLYVYPAELAFPVPEHSLSSPADAVGSFSVGATEWSDDTLAFYSSQGPTDDGRIKPDISAPTTVSGVSYGPEGFDGTSAAAPHVAGAAALVWSAHPEFSREDVIAFLEANALDLGLVGPDPAYGYGRLLLPDPGQVAPAPIEAPTSASIPTEPPAPEPPPTSPAVPTEPAASEPLPTIPTIPTVVPTTGPPPTASSSLTGSRDNTAANTTALAGLITAFLGGLMCCGGFVFLGGLGMLLLKPRRRPPAPGPLPPSPAATPAKPWIEVAGRRYELPVTGLTIGRVVDNDIVLGEDTVSRHHARLVLQRGIWYVQDLGSANGTLVNDRRIKQQPLRDGDRISIESNTFIFHTITPPTTPHPHTASAP